MVPAALGLTDGGRGDLGWRGTSSVRGAAPHGSTQGPQSWGPTGWRRSRPGVGDCLQHPVGMGRDLGLTTLPLSLSPFRSSLRVIERCEQCIKCFSSSFFFLKTILRFLKFLFPRFLGSIAFENCASPREWDGWGGGGGGDGG